MNTSTIFLVERDPTLRRWISVTLARRGFAVKETQDPAQVWRTLRRKQWPALFLINTSLAVSGDGLHIAQLLHDGATRVPVLLMTVQSSEELILAALRAGVADYLKLPCSADELIASVERCLPGTLRPLHDSPLHAHARTAELARLSVADSMTSPMIGESPAMLQIKAYLRKVAASDSNTLIIGETGTGKELVASFVHKQSRRRQRPFVGINCAAIPDGLLESELFGYERGAFTGAYVAKEGSLELANGGTVFFDEIGDMSPYTQAKILRVIESKEVRRLGGKRSIALDVRFVAATNRDLEKLMMEEKFRSDLYFRLNVANVHIPPLRERKEDLLSLCLHYIQEMNQQFGLAVEGFSEDAFTALLCYSWPGNVRELKNLIEGIFVNLPSELITYNDLPEQFRRRCLETTKLPQDERDRLLQALFATHWNKRQAAQQLHWSRMTLYRKLRKYHIVSGGKKTKSTNSAPKDH